MPTPRHGKLKLQKTGGNLEMQTAEHRRKPEMKLGEEILHLERNKDKNIWTQTTMGVSVGGGGGGRGYGGSKW